MRPVRLTKSLATADDDNIAASQTPLAAGNLTINGAAATGSPAVAVLDSSRQVILTFAGDETGHNFTIYGFDQPTGGSARQETIAGTTAGVVAATLDYGRVTQVSISAAATAGIKVGTNGVGSTPWFLVDWNLNPNNITIGVDVSGTVNYTVQYTYDDILGAYDPAGIGFTNGYPTKIWDDAVLAAVTTDGDTTFSNPISAWRVKINSGTGALRITGISAGVGGTGS